MGMATPSPILAPAVMLPSPVSLDSDELDAVPTISPIVLDAAEFIGLAVLAGVVEVVDTNEVVELTRVVALDVDDEPVLSFVILNVSLIALGLVFPS